MFCDLARPEIFPKLWIHWLDAVSMKKVGLNLKNFRAGTMLPATNPICDVYDVGDCSRNKNEPNSFATEFHARNHHLQRAST